MASVQPSIKHQQAYSSSLIAPTSSYPVAVHHPSHPHRQHRQYYSIVGLPEICLIRILSYLPLMSLLTITREVCQHWRHKLVPHAVLMALRRQEAGCTIYMNPPYLQFSWVYNMSQADCIHLSPVAIDPSQDVVIFKPVRLPNQTGSAAEGWMRTETNVVNAALRAVRHFKVEFSGWPSGASARRYTRRQIKNRERRRELALQLASSIRHESARQNSFYKVTSASRSNVNINLTSTTSIATTSTTTATTAHHHHHLLNQSSNSFNNARPSSQLDHYEVTNTTTVSVDESTLATHAPQGNDEEDEYDDGIVEVTDPANQGYANVAAAAVMDADDQEPGTNGPVHYHHLSLVQQQPPPITNITSNEVNITNNNNINNATLDVSSTTVSLSLSSSSSNTSVLINVEEDEDELNSETDDATSEDASINQQHPPVQAEIGWNGPNAADEWVRAWHRLHATYRPTFETFYTAEPIPGYRASTGFNSWYQKSISLTDWELEQLNHIKNNDNNNNCIDSLITGGYTGDSGIAVRYEHHPKFGFRIIWLRVSFAWLLSGWFVSAPDTRGPAATAAITTTTTSLGVVPSSNTTSMTDYHHHYHNEYSNRQQIGNLSPPLSQHVQALDPYSHVNITPSMGQTLVSSNGTWLGPIRPIFLLDGPDGVAAPETDSPFGRSRYYVRGRRLRAARQLLHRIHHTGRAFCRKLSCVSLNNHIDNETRRSLPISSILRLRPVPTTTTNGMSSSTQRASRLFLPDPMPEPYQPPPHQASLPIHAARLYELQTAIENYGKLASSELATLIRDSMSSMGSSLDSSHDALLLSNTLNATSNPLHWLIDPYNPMTIAWCAGELNCTALEFLQWQCTQMTSSDYMVTCNTARRRRMVETGLCMIGCDPTALWKYKHAKRYIIQGGVDQSMITVTRVAASERAYAKHLREVAATRDRAREQQRLAR
jgi:hypothetical protein